MSKHSIVRWIKIIGVYLLVAAVAALGWLWCALPEEVYLEPEQTLTLPRFGWVEPLRGHGSRNVASTRAAGSYQTTLALGGWLPVKTIRATVMQRPTVTVCGTPFGVKMFSEGALVVGFSEVHTAAGTINPAKQAGLRLGDRVIRMGNTVTETNEQVHAALEAAAGAAVEVVYVRKGEQRQTTLCRCGIKDPQGGGGGGGGGASPGGGGSCLWGVGGRGIRRAGSPYQRQ